MNIEFDLYKTGVFKDIQITSKTLKKAQYFLSHIQFNSSDTLYINLNSLLIDDISDEIGLCLKKTMNILLYLIQTNRLSNVVITITAYKHNPFFIAGLKVFAFSGLCNRISICTEHTFSEANDLLENYPELKINTRYNRDIMHKRFILDRKGEYLYQEGVFEC